MDKAILTAIIIAACSFILQKTLGNILYGIIIFISRPFKKGDKVSILQSGKEIASGYLIKRTPLHIYIKTYSRDVIIIPNSVLENCVVQNSDYKEGVNYTNIIKVSFDSNLEKTISIIENLLISDGDTNNTKENTHIVLKTDSGGIIIEYNVRTDTIEQSFDVCSNLKRKLVTEIQNYKDIELV